MQESRRMKLAALPISSSVLRDQVSDRGSAKGSSYL